MATTESVLVVAAHPDDEVLGCGGTIARHAAAGDVVTVLILADGVTSRRDEDRAAASIEARRRSARHANDVLGVRELTLLSYPDNRLDSVPLLDVVQEIERIVAHCRPSTVYTHARGDVNVDHGRVHDAVLAACRPQPGCGVRRLLFFETPSSSEWRTPHSAALFSPNWFIDISATLPAKLEALAAYAAELRPFPHPRSSVAVEHLARWRGASVGLDAAEAFELGRSITS